MLVDDVDDDLESDMADGLDPQEIKAIAELASFYKSKQSDVLYYVGLVNKSGARMLSTHIEQLAKHKRCMVYLKTVGGDAHAAFQIGRSLKRTYGENVTIYVDSLCKSAGTLISLTANQLVMWDTAELGPMDVQTLMPDEIVALKSGLATVKALQYLQKESFEFFQTFLLEISQRSQGQITTRTACDVASSLAGGMMGELYKQLDPVRLCESMRHVEIARAYGERLASANVRSCAIGHLIEDYPSHEFVIDREEAKSLFLNVRAPHQDEKNFFGTLASVGRSDAHPPKCGLFVLPDIDVIAKETPQKPVASTRRRRQQMPKPRVHANGKA